MQVHRRLCQAVTNPDLDSFSRNARGATPAVDAYYAKGRDHGTTHYYHETKTREQAMFPAPGTIRGYLTLRSPKLKLLLNLAY